MRTILFALLATALGTLTHQAFAQPYPSKPIRLIVPQAPGSNSDIVSRIIAGKLSEL
ncbi:MAG: tripartite tricarboxylate transporter substrate binding protein, partial [Betaproteobacteria bacterium]|nr:tripartite tricarboxylate transporter substrate binding protein [Betaproteobacteria bacterium]